MVWQEIVNAVAGEHIKNIEGATAKTEEATFQVVNKTFGKKSHQKLNQLCAANFVNGI